MLHGIRARLAAVSWPDAGSLSRVPHSMVPSDTRSECANESFFLFLRLRHPRRHLKLPSSFGELARGRGVRVPHLISGCVLDDAATFICGNHQREAVAIHGNRPQTSRMNKWMPILCPSIYSSIHLNQPTNQSLWALEWPVRPRLIQTDFSARRRGC